MFSFLRSPTLTSIRDLQTRTHFLFLSFTSYVTLGELQQLSKPSSCCLTNGNNKSAYLIRLLWVLSNVWIWGLDRKEGWALKNWCFWTVVLEKTLERPLDSKEIKPANPKGNQLWIFIGRTDAEAPILWPPDVKSQLIGKDPEAGKDRKQEKGTTEDKMVGWHHWLNGRESEWTPGVGNGQGGLAAAIHGVAKSRTWLSQWTELKFISRYFILFDTILNGIVFFFDNLF